MRISSLVDRFLIKNPRLRKVITGLYVRDKDIIADIFGSPICINTHKEHGYYRAFRKSRNNTLLRDELSTIINLALLLEDGDTFIDIGANVGVFSAILHRLNRVAPRTRFHAFEPHPETYQRLVKTLAHTDVVTHQLALSDSAGTVEFVEGAVSHVFAHQSAINAYHIAENTVVVSCERLDNLPIQGDSMVLKIDVEGLEMQVLQGANGFFETHRIKAVYLDGYADRKVVNLLEKYGFAFYDGETLQPSTPDIFRLLALGPAFHIWE